MTSDAEQQQQLATVYVGLEFPYYCFASDAGTVASSLLMASSMV